MQEARGLDRVTVSLMVQSVFMWIPEAVPRPQAGAPIGGRERAGTARAQGPGWAGPALLATGRRVTSPGDGAVPRGPGEMGCVTPPHSVMMPQVGQASSIPTVSHTLRGPVSHHGSQLTRVAGDAAEGQTDSAHSSGVACVRAHWALNPAVVYKRGDMMPGSGRSPRTSVSPSAVRTPQQP